MSGYSKLWSQIVTSSIWSEDDKTRIVWITLLALKDADGFVAASLPGLAKIAAVTLEDCEKSVVKLEAPDIHSSSKEFEGRRIEKVEGGWIVLNHFKYRDSTVSDDIKTAQARERMRKMRNGSVTKGNSVTPVFVYGSVSDLVKKQDSRFGNDEAFMSALKEWIECRMAIGKKPKNWTTMFVKQMQWLYPFGLSSAVEIINQSIRNNWQGLFPLKTQSGFNKQPTEDHARAEWLRAVETVANMVWDAKGTGPDAARNACKAARDKFRDCPKFQGRDAVQVGIDRAMNNERA